MSDLRPSRDFTMLHIASAISKRSTCCRRGVGCVLTDVHGRVLSMGHNGVPMGLPHCTDEPCKGASFPSGTGLSECHAVHAEQNALAFCSDIMKIDTCYTTTSPCEICIKQLLNTSCRRIVFFDEYAHPISKKLWEQAGRKWVHYDEDLDQRPYVYLHSKPNGDVFYVGKGTKKRAFCFNRQYNSYYANIIAKYGDKDIQVTLIPVQSEKEAFDLEKDLIALLRLSFNLANMTEGGDGFTSAYLKGKPSNTKGKKFPNRKKPAVPVWNKGKSLTEEQRKNAYDKKLVNMEETKKKLSKALLGKNKGKTAWNKGTGTSPRKLREYEKNT